MRQARLFLLGVVTIGVFVIAGNHFVTPAPLPKPAVPRTESVGEVVATQTQIIAPKEVTIKAGTTLYKVEHVVDGDTIDVTIEGEVKRVRYIGVDTPETVHPSKAVECFGAEASAKNKELVEGKLVRLERDISETDKYGRLLRYVYVDDVFINMALVEGGYASTLTYPPDVEYNEEFRLAEASARTEKRGLWGAGCEREARSNVWSPVMGVTDSDGRACTIKGNISLDGELIYHVPGCEYYAQTVITETKGERMFCSEGEAVQAGWRKALNCE